MSSEQDSGIYAQILGVFVSAGGVLGAFVRLFSRQTAQQVEIKQLQKATEDGFEPHEVRLTAVEKIQARHGQEITDTFGTVARIDERTIKTGKEVTAIFEIINDRKS